MDDALLLAAIRLDRLAFSQAEEVDDWIGWEHPRIHPEPTIIGRLSQVASLRVCSLR